MRQALIYSLKVWLATSIVSPTILTILHLVFLRRNLNLVHINQYDAPQAYHRVISKFPLMVVGNVVLLIPLCVALYFALVVLQRRGLPSTRYKWYLSIVGICFAPLPEVFLIGYEILTMTSQYLRESLVWNLGLSCVVVVLSVLASVWFYKLKPTNVIPPNQPTQ